MERGAGSQARAWSTEQGVKSKRAWSEGLRTREWTSKNNPRAPCFLVLFLWLLAPCSLLHVRL